MKPRALSLRPIAISLFVGLLLVACGSGAEEATPTFTVEQIQTEAVATFSAGLTETALAMPTETPTSTATPIPTATSLPEVTNTAVPTIGGTIPPASCEGSAFVSDVTIPDNTTITPGQVFTKTWRVRNIGTCAWQTSFELNFTGGERMDGTSGSLLNTIQPGDEVDVSVEMTAPDTAGTYRGNWRMVNEAGAFFGDEIYVLIVVGDSTATPTTAASETATTVATATETPTPTETPTETATP
jgi:hypothetical protein